jgi:hypothetical protein
MPDNFDAEPPHGTITGSAQLADLADAGPSLADFLFTI